MRWLLLVVTLLGAACGELPSRSSDLDGVVTQVDAAASPATMRVEGVAPGGGAVASLVRITEGTNLYRDIGGVYERITVQQVRAGPRVRARVWLMRPILGSAPFPAHTIVVWTLAP